MFSYIKKKQKKTHTGRKICKFSVRCEVILFYLFIFLNIKIGFLRALLVRIRYPDEPHRRNCSSLVPDSRNNFCKYVCVCVCVCELVKLFTYLGSSVSSTETDTNTRLAKTWTAFDRLSATWKSDLTDKIKRSFFQAAVVPILLYGCTTWTLTERMKKKYGDGNYTRMLRAILNKSWKQHPTKQQLYGHLPLITETIKIRRTRLAGHCWRSSQLEPTTQQICADTGCSPEDLPEAMDDREG